MRRCIDCKAEKEDEAFSPGQLLRKYPECRLCKTKNSKRYRKEHPDKAHAWHQSYRKKHPESEARRRQRFTAEHRELTRQRARAYRLANMDKENARKRKYRAAHPEKRRAEHVRNKFGMSQEDVQKMIDGQGGRCASCGDKLAPGRHTHIDHDHATGQIRGILCRSCNLAEGYLRGSALRAEKLAAYLKRNAPKLKLVGV